MTPEELTHRLERDLGRDLKSVILYGSAAAGDHAGKRSDHNILVVVQELGVEQLRAVSQTAKAWAKAGNRPPLLFTPESLRRSVDTFPIELLDMRDSHRVLQGEDLVQGLAPDPRDLRLQLEHDLKTKLIQLREHYMLAAGKPRNVVELMVGSVASFLALSKAALRLFRDQVPPKKLDALKALTEHLGLDVGAFATVHEIKEGKRKSRHVDAERLFEQYLKSVEAIADAVDKHMEK